MKRKTWKKDLKYFNINCFIDWWCKACITELCSDVVLQRLINSILDKCFHKPLVYIPLVRKMQLWRVQLTPIYFS